MTSKPNSSRADYHAVLTFLVLFCLVTPVAPAQEEKPVKIVSLMPDFYAFWEQAKVKPLEEQIDLWNSLFEAKHGDLYAQMIYESRTGDELELLKRDKLAGFLSSLTEDEIQVMKAKEEELKELIPLAISDLQKVFLWATEVTTHYLLPSLNTSTGDARPFKGDLVACYGVELAKYLGDQSHIKALIVHETFHLLHFKKLLPHFLEKYGADFNMHDIMLRESPVFMAFLEGLGVIAQEKIYPDAPRPGIFDNLIPKYEENFAAYTEEFMKDLGNFDFEKYKRYFVDPSDDPFIPTKFGYWLGYKIAASLNEQHSIEEMASWTPGKATQMAVDKLSFFANPE